MTKAYVLIAVVLGVGAGGAYIVGWFFDSLKVALILFGLWALVLFPYAWTHVRLARAMLLVEEDMKREGLTK